MLLLTHAEMDLLAVDEYPNLDDCNREMRTPSYWHILTQK